MSAKKIKLKIITPERIVFETDVEQATLPVADGEVTILPNHMAYIAALKAGEILIKNEKEDWGIAVSGGFVEFRHNELSILADTAERAEEIDLQRAEAGRKRAEEIMREKVALNDVGYARVAAAIEKEAARIRVAHKYRSHREIQIEQ